MKNSRRKFKVSKIVLLLIIACIVVIFTISKSNKSETPNILTTEYHAAATDSRYVVTDDGFDCSMATQHNGYVCYAYSLCRAMEARVFKIYGENVNFSEVHMADTMNKGTVGSYTTQVWDEYLEPMKGPYEEGASEMRYKATGYVQVPADVGNMKQYIVDYGGIDVGVAWGNSSYWRQNGDYWVMATPSDGPGINHGVTVIGWDDGFESSNFPGEWGVTEDGAFLAYNPANGSLLWISYQDKNVMAESYVIDMEKIEEVDPPEPTYQFSTDGLTINDVSYGGEINITYTGSSVENQLLVTAFYNTEGAQLHEGTDFNVTYSENTAVGTFKMFINGIGNYDGQQLTQDINITPKDIATIDSVEIKQVNDDDTVNVEAKFGDITLVNDTDYTIEYIDSTTQGKKIAKISGKGNYNGWVEREFSINSNPGPTPPIPDEPDNKLSIKIKDFKEITSDEIMYIVAIPEKTSITNFKKGIETNGTIKLYDGETEVTDNNSTIKTGMKVTFTKDKDVKEGLLVVNGDVNGDGIIDGIDLMKVSRYVSEADKNLTGAYLIAANVHEQTKNNTINNNDSLRIARYLISLEKDLK